MQKTQEMHVQSLGLKIPWKWHPTPAFLPEKVRGQGSLAGYNPGGHRESDMIEHTNDKSNAL